MAADTRAAGKYAGCTVPPAVYDLAFGTDPRPEIDRLCLLAREAGARVDHVLELGCGTGRLLRAWETLGVRTTGIELSGAMACFAQLRCGGEIHVGDMSRFALGRTFDLIYTSANTIRHVCRSGQIRSMWGCIRHHLTPRGLFIADLELGIDAEAARAGRSVRWNLTTEEGDVHVCWRVIRPPGQRTRCSRIRWEFELRRHGKRQSCSEEFDLRTYDGPEFVALAEAGRLKLVRMYELRVPYLIPLPPERAAGRMLVVLRPD